jgi:hypothetical protein
LQYRAYQLLSTAVLVRSIEITLLASAELHVPQRAAPRSPFAPFWERRTHSPPFEALRFSSSDKAIQCAEFDARGGRTHLLLAIVELKMGLREVRRRRKHSLARLSPFFRLIRLFW